VEGSAPSEAEEETAHGIRSRKVGAPATRDSFSPLLGGGGGGRERNEENPLDDGDNLD
jgi:hypothetical protein